jgi:hypothetical protein
VQQTVATHGAWLVVLNLFTSGLSFVPAAATAVIATTIVWRIFLAGDCCGELGDLVRHGLDLCGHCIHHHLCAVVDVGSLFFLGNRCLGSPGNVLPQFVTVVGLGCLIGTLKAVLASHAAAVLLVDCVVPDEAFKVGHCFVKTVLDGFRLVFPLCHLFFVKVI